jgi:hypothetical protein
MMDIDEDDYRIRAIESINTEVCKKLCDDYLNTVHKLTGLEMFYNRLAISLAIIAFFFTGLGSVLAFSAGYFKFLYISYAAGCCNVIAMMSLKASYYSNSQSHYHDIKLKNHLTKDYKFLYKFIMNPLSLSPVNDPSMPDPSGENNYNNYKTPPPSGNRSTAIQTPKFPWNTPKVRKMGANSAPNLTEFGIVPPLNIPVFQDTNKSENLTKKPIKHKPTHTQHPLHTESKIDTITISNDEWC